VGAVTTERKRLFAKLGELGFLQPFPSQANFILCAIVKGDAEVIHGGLQKKGIFVRYFNTPLLRNSLRISVGTPEHTDALIETLKELC